MIPVPSPQFEIEEAKRLEATPVYRFTFFPQDFGTGVAAGSGEFTNCAFVAPSRLEVDNGVLAAAWIGPAQQPITEQFPVDAEVSWVSNPAVMTESAYYRTAATAEALALASWEVMTNGAVLSLREYYQFKFAWEGVRGYALPTEDENDPVAAYALPAVDPEDPFLSWACPGDGPPVYVEDLTLIGAYVISPENVKNAGSVSLVSSPDFSELVAGEHILLLFDDDGRYNPDDAANFIFRDETYWEDKKLRFEYGFRRPGTKIDDFLIRYEGEILDWRTVPPELDEEARPAARPYAEIYTNDWVSLTFKRTVTQPLADGAPNPLVMGAGVREAQQVTSANLFPPYKTADYETGDLSQVDAAEEGTNGEVLVTAANPIKNNYSCKTTVTATAGSKALVRLNLTAPAARFYTTGWFRTLEKPLEPQVNLGAQILCGLHNSSLVDILYIGIGADNKLQVRIGGTSYTTDKYLTSYLGSARLSIGLSVGNPGIVKIWINDDEIFSDTDINTSGLAPFGAWWGVKTNSFAETWSFLLDNISISNQWEPYMYQVAGAPFEEISEVYTDGRLIMKKTTGVAVRPGISAIDTIGYVGGTLASNYTAVPELGAIIWHDFENLPSGSIFFRFRKNTTYHPIDALIAMLTAWGLEDKISASYFALAKAATPEYDLPVLYYFDQTTKQAEAIIEICRRFLISFFLDQGQIRCRAWVAHWPRNPTFGYAYFGYDHFGMSTATEIVGASVKAKPVSRKLSDLVAQVTVKCGWYDRNPDMMHQAKNTELLEKLGDSGLDLDFSWGQPVAMEELEIAKAIANRLLARLQAHKREPEVSGWLEFGRYEIGDEVTLEDQIYEVQGVYFRAEDNPPGCDLQLIRFPGVQYGIA
jgi:hypothetical protein